MTNDELVTVDRGDGHTFQMKPSELGAFKVNNAAAFIVGEKKARKTAEVEASVGGAEVEADTSAKGKGKS